MDVNTMVKVRVSLVGGLKGFIEARLEDEDFPYGIIFVDEDGKERVYERSITLPGAIRNVANLYEELCLYGLSKSGLWLT